MAKATIIYHTTDTDLDEDQSVDVDVDILTLTGDQITEPVTGIRLPEAVVAAGWRAFKVKYKLKNVSRLGYTVSALVCTEAEEDHVRAAVKAWTSLAVARINSNTSSLGRVFGIAFPDVAIMDEVPHPRDC